VTATIVRRQQGSKSSTYDTTVTIHVERYFWIHHSRIPSSFALPIRLTQVAEVGNCDSSNSATSGDKYLRSPEFRKNGVQTNNDTADRLFAVRQA